MKRSALCLLVLAWLSACAPQTKPVPTYPPATTTPSSVLVLTPRSTATLTATITSLPSFTPEPTFVSPPTQTPVPASWQTYTNPDLHLSLRYPPDWNTVSPTRYAGPDGFIEISTRFYPISEFDNIDSLCVLEANSSKSGLYGANPKIFNANILYSADTPWQVIGCIVSPGETRPGAPSAQAALFMRMPAPWRSEHLVELRADAAHITGILSTLRFADTVTSTPSSGVYDSPACAQTPPGPAETTSHFNGLTIHEVAIAIRECDPYNEFDGFRNHPFITSADGDHIYSQGLVRQIAEANQALKPFGYHLVGLPAEEPTVCDLYQGDKVLVATIDRLGPVSVNDREDDFILWVQDNLDNKGPVEVRRGSLRELPVLSDNQGFNTAWIGSDLVSYVYDFQDLDNVGPTLQANILRNGKMTGRISVPPPGPPGFPIVGFWSWNHHWILEATNVVFQDGEILNRTLSYDEIFDWRLVKGQPFFFYRQGGAFGLVYGGQTLPQRYDDVIHGQLCCDPAVYNILSTANGAWFYARKGGIWYLVSIRA